MQYDEDDGDGVDDHRDHDDVGSKPIVSPLALTNQKGNIESATRLKQKYGRNCTLSR